MSQPYSNSADVYSFGVLLWEICATEQPYRSMSDAMVERKVINCGVRPKIDPKWPNPVRRLLQDCFASNPRRPTMSVICDVLRGEIKSLSGKAMIDDADELESARSALSARYYR